MPDLVRLIQGIEAAGFDGAGILDSQMLSRDTFVVLGQAATHTSRLTLFPAVTNPFTRHASVLAGAIQTVEELAPGRVKFVIGTGYTSASTIGRSPATLAEMRECIRAVKALLAGKTVDFHGTPGRLGYASGREIPVLMAASGAKAIELAGEIADGVLLNWIPPEAVPASITHLETGARRAGRTLDGFEIASFVRTCVTDDATAARETLARDITGYATVDVYASFFRTAGYPDEVAAVGAAWASGDRAGAVKRVSPRMLDGLGVVGDEAFCRARIAEFARAGITQPVIVPFAPAADRASLLRTLRTFP